jgi:hypothetical protein
VSVDLAGGHFDHTVTPGVGTPDRVGDEFVDQKAGWDGVTRRQRHCVSRKLQGIILRSAVQFPAKLAHEISEFNETHFRASMKGRIVVTQK